MADVIYRKYRPQKFDQVIGQEHITYVLEEQLKNNNLSHAYLFTGSRGTGKTTVARIFASEINKIEDNIENLDIIEIDAASNRGIDDIRELRDKITYSPSKSQYKVYIIDEVHMLTKEAFNALLKTLEEPPKHVIFIFATTEPHKIPITILSRVTRFDFKLATYESLKKKFGFILKSEKIKFEEDVLDIVIKHSKGSFRDGESLLTKIISSLNDKKLTVDMVNKLVGLVESDIINSLVDKLSANDTSGLIQLLTQLKADGKNLDIVFSQLIIELEAMMISQINKKGSEIRLELGRIIEVINELSRALNESKNDLLYGLSYELALIKLTYSSKSSLSLPLTQKVNKSNLDNKVSAETASIKISRKETLQLDSNDKIEVKDEVVIEETSSVFQEGEIFEWRQFVKRISDEHFKLAALLMNTRLIDNNDGTLTIEVPYAYYKQKLETKELKLTLDGLLQKEYNKSELKVMIKHNPELQKKEKGEGGNQKKKDSNIDIVEEVFNI